MQYSQFRDTIRGELERHPDGLTWRELKDRLGLPYERPCPTWTARLEREIGLVRQRGRGLAKVWALRRAAS